METGILLNGTDLLSLFPSEHGTLKTKK